MCTGFDDRVDSVDDDTQRKNDAYERNVGLDIWCGGVGADMR